MNSFLVLDTYLVLITIESEPKSDFSIKLVKQLPIAAGFG
jgi:hypothetical protein